MRAPGKTARRYAASLRDGMDFALDISRVNQRQGPAVLGPGAQGRQNHNRYNTTHQDHYFFQHFNSVLIPQFSP
jgi:hypothetical protein